MRRFFPVFVLVLAVFASAARAEDPDTDGHTVAVGVLRRRLLASGGAPEEVTGWVVRRQFSYPQSHLSAEEFFAFFHELVGYMSDQGFDARPFLDNTKSLYAAFRPTWTDVKRGIALARGSKEMRSGMKFLPNQSAFFVLHVPADAPELTVKGLAVLHQLPALDADKKLSVWGQVLPLIVEPPDGTSEADHFFAVYNDILAALNDSPDAQVAFYQGTASQYRSFDPSPEVLLRSAKAIHIRLGRKLGDDFGLPNDAADAYSRYEYLWYHVGRPETHTDLEKAAALVAAYQRYVGQSNDVQQHLHTRRHGDRGFVRDWDGQRHYLEAIAYVGAHERYVRAGQSAQVFDLLVSFAPSQVDQTTLPRIESIVQHLDRLLGRETDGSDYLLRELRRAVDLPSFDRLFDLMERRRERARAQIVANDRLAQIRDWNPAPERLRALHGGSEVSTGKLREMHRPDYFLVLFADALGYHRWDDPEALEAFVAERIDPFFANEPSFAQMWEFLTLLRDKPVPHSRLEIERRAMEALKQAPPDIARPAFHGYLAYRLGAALEIERPLLRITRADDRKRLRDELWTTTADARHGVYGAQDVETLLAEWFTETASKADLPCSLPLRLLVLLSDTMSPTAAGHVGPTFATMARGHWDDPRFALATRLAMATVNQFTPIAGDTSRPLEKFTPSDWKLVEEEAPVRPQAAAVAPTEANCGPALAAPPKAARWSWKRPFRWSGS